MILAAGAYWLVGAPTCIAAGVRTFHMKRSWYLGRTRGTGLATAAVLMCSRFAAAHPRTDAIKSSCVIQACPRLYVNGDNIGSWTP